MSTDAAKAIEHVIKELNPDIHLQDIEHIALKQELNESTEILWIGSKTSPRKQASLVSENCKCCHRYGNVTYKPTIFPKWFSDITKRVLYSTGLVFEYLPNSCNVNWYKDAYDCVGWHSDDEKLFGSVILIIRLLLGQNRKLNIQNNVPDVIFVSFLFCCN